MKALLLSTVSKFVFNTSAIQISIWIMTFEWLKQCSMFKVLKRAISIAVCEQFIRTVLQQRGSSECFSDILFYF